MCVILTHTVASNRYPQFEGWQFLQLSKKIRQIVAIGYKIYTFNFRNDNDYIELNQTFDYLDRFKIN